MNKLLLLSLSSFSLVLFSGCGPSGDCCDDDAQTATVEANLTSITVERGPLYFASVKDLNGLIAKNANFGMSNVYTFTEKPTPPILVTGGYVDVNRNGLLDANDTKLDVNMSSYSNVVSPLTTFVGDTQSDSTKLNYLTTNYNVTKAEIFDSVPSETSADVLILTNALYKSLKLGYIMGSTEFNASISDLNDTYNATYDTITDLTQLSVDLEETTMTDLGQPNLNATDLIDIEGLLTTDYYVNSDDINGSTFTRVKNSTDDVSDIWNIAFKIPYDSDVSNFDMGIHIVKRAGGAIGNIIVKGISIKENKVLSIGSLVIFGKKSTGATGARGYSSSEEITKNSILLLQDKLLFNLGGIINSQTIVSTSSFTNATIYDVNIYVTKLDVNGSSTTSDTSLQVGSSTYYTFPTTSQEINGTLEIQ